MSESRTVTAAMLIIGNEILSGRTVDANLPHLATRLNERGVQLAEARIVRDIEAEIVDAVKALSVRHDYLFTTGGIGPTHDDITAASIAKAFDWPFERHPEAARILEQFYGDRVNPARMSMADMPRGVTLIDNPVSRAPGFRIANVFVMAGVPKIMQAMLDGILPTLEGGTPVQSATVTVYRPESELAPLLQVIVDAIPTVDIGSYPFMRMDRPGSSIVFRSTDGAALARARRQLIDALRADGAAFEA